MDLRLEVPVAAGDCEARGAVRGRAAQFVAVAGARRGGDAAGLGDILGDRRRMARGQGGAGGPYAWWNWHDEYDRQG
ncbi:MAG TPA: hypothetical protein VHN16_05840 [Streptosporangiaceae bacterium]|nr:hypothetical protein [Streptosporangiaceae bacterium]